MFDIKSMSIEDKIAQTKAVLAKNREKITGKPGAVFFGAQIITEADNDGLDEVRNFVNDIYDDSEIPPLITSDFEFGCGGMINGLTKLPFMMGLGATRDKQLAYDYGKVTAIEARSIGANWTFSPVADLNINKRNPLVNIRSLSDDVDLAVRMIPNVVRGMQDYGLAACAKHFPGDGIDWRDQHIMTTYNYLPMNEWWEKSGRVFKTLIDEGVYTIMPGHIGLPAYTKDVDDDLGLPYPATLSYELISVLLKKELGFDGVVVTDALNMGGFNRWYERERAEVESFKAGCDMMLWPSESYDENLKKAIESGYVSMERLDDAVQRIMALKEKLGLFDETRERFRKITDEEAEFIKNVKEKAFSKSMTLLRNKENLLPIDKTKVKKVMLIPISEFKPFFEEAKYFKKLLEDNGLEVIYQEVRDGDFDKNMKEADLVIYAFYSRPFRPMGFIDFTDHQALKLQCALRINRKKTIGVSFGSPYFFKQYFDNCSTFVNAYSPYSGAAEAFVKAMVGEEEFNDFSPVEL